MTLEQQLAALKEARASGELRIAAEGKSIEYRSIAELNAAIIAVQAEINAAQPRPPSRLARTYASKGI